MSQEFNYFGSWKTKFLERNWPPQNSFTHLCPTNQPDVYVVATMVIQGPAPIRFRVQKLLKKSVVQARLKSTAVQFRVFFPIQSTEGLLS